MKSVDYSKDIEGAARILKDGGVVVVPTETVYGLGALGKSQQAVKKLYELKGRPESKPISLLVSGPEAIEELCIEPPPAAKALAEAFWPGPLTLVLKAGEDIPEAVSAGSGTVGLRCPDQQQTLELLRQLGEPLAAPSANLSGEPSPGEISQVLEFFGGKIDGYIDGGPCALGVESTVMDLSETPYRILRRGAAAENDINVVLMSSLTIIGITGGTGCGKTTALECIRELGGLVIDCDELYHELLLGCEPMRDEINSRFPGALAPGSGDTKALGEIVFSDPEALRALNAITHKYVGMETNRRLTGFAKNGGTLAAIDAIALIESGIGSYCKETVGIIAPTEDRIQRLMKREGIDRRYAKLRIDAQKSNEYFIENCDHTLMNDGTMEEFKEKCRRLFEEIIRR